jgi:hypothetical protein
MKIFFGGTIHPFDSKKWNIGKWRNFSFGLSLMASDSKDLHRKFGGFNL